MIFISRILYDYSCTFTSDDDDALLLMLLKGRNHCWYTHRFRYSLHIRTVPGQDKNFDDETRRE